MPAVWVGEMLIFQRLDEITAYLCLLPWSCVTITGMGKQYLGTPNLGELCL